MSTEEPHGRGTALLVAHQYFPTPGAATQRLGGVVGELRRRGWDVVVLTSAPPEGIASADRGPAGEHIRTVVGAERSGTGVRRILALLWFASRSWAVGRRLKYSLVITDPPPTAAMAARLLARRRSAKFVYYMCDSWSGVARDAPGLAGRLHRVIKALEDSVLVAADVVISATPGMAAIAEGAGASAVVTAENGVPLDVFHPNGPVWRPTASPRPYFVYAGNAGVVHGAEIFAHAAERLWSRGVDFDLVYLGYGAEHGEIRDIQRRVPDRLHILGNVPADRVAAAYRGAIGALSSLRPAPQYADARPIKTLTGLACGCPPIYAGSGRFADLLASENLGLITAYDQPLVEASLERAIELDKSATGEWQRTRDRCAQFARGHLDLRRTAESAVRAIESAG